MSNKNIAKLFGWLAIIGPLHMIEQLVFGIDELAELKPLLAGYYSWFADPDFATVLLVTIFGALFLLCVYGAAAGGRWLTAIATLIAIMCLGEIHHVVKAVTRVTYNPGLVMAIPFVAIGVLLIRTMVRQRGSAALSPAA
jgi:hypothetical protein